MLYFKLLLGIIGTILGFVGLVRYIRDVFSGKTKPHAFSWFVWGIIESIVFIAQVMNHGGIGSMIAGISAATSLFIAIVAFSKREVLITAADWAALILALVGVILWQVTSNPLLAVIAVTAADLFGFVPTFRKAFQKPFEETIVEYEMSAFKWFVSIFALGAISLTTVLYPVSLIITNGLFVTMVLIRRNRKVS